MEILFLPMLSALLFSSMAYGYAYARTRNRHMAGVTVQHYTHGAAPYILVMLWPVFDTQLGHSGVQYIQFTNVFQDAFYGICVGAIMGYIALQFAEWVSRRYPGTREMRQGALSVIGLVLIAPIVEEIVFRGLGAEVSASLNVYAGFVLTSLAFALWHMNPFLTVPAFIFGLVASALYFYTHSLFAPIVAHIVSNFAYWRWSLSSRRYAG